MTVYETDIPGVGRKFEVELDGEERAVVIIHHDGKREVFRRPAADADSERVFSLSGEQARRLGSILGGAYFQPVELEDAEVPLGDAFIEWVTVDEGSPLAGRSLGGAGVRAETGVSVLAVQRGEETHANPDPEFELEPGDVLVALGTREEQAALADLVGGSDAERA
jgi:TrkA domain protein